MVVVFSYGGLSLLGAYCSAYLNGRITVYWDRDRHVGISAGAVFLYMICLAESKRVELSAITLDLNSILKEKIGIGCARRRLSELLPDTIKSWNFAEFYARTGKSIEVIVTTAKGKARLLNKDTSPTCNVFFAVTASASPFEPLYNHESDEFFYDGCFSVSALPQTLFGDKVGILFLSEDSNQDFIAFSNFIRYPIPILGETSSYRTWVSLPRNRKSANNVKAKLRLLKQLCMVPQM